MKRTSLTIATLLAAASVWSQQIPPAAERYLADQRDIGAYAVILVEADGLGTTHVRVQQYHG